MFHMEPVSANNWGWIHEKIQPHWVEDTTGLVMTDESKPVAACVMDSWTDNGCTLHIVIENPMVLRRGFLEEIFWYVFEERGLKMVWGFTPGDKKAALNFNDRVGMKEMFVMEDAQADGVDLVVTRMLRSECRWIGEEHGQERQSTA